VRFLVSLALAFVALLARGAHCQEASAGPGESAPAPRIEVRAGADVPSGVARFPSTADDRLRKADDAEAASIQELVARADVLVVGLGRADPRFPARHPEVGESAPVSYYEAMTHFGKEKSVRAGRAVQKITSQQLADWVVDYMRSGWFSIGGMNQRLVIKQWSVNDGPARATAIMRSVSTVKDDTGGGTATSEGVIHIELDRATSEIRVFTWGSPYSVAND
jgi:hypothetical protein